MVPSKDNMLRQFVASIDDVIDILGTRSTDRSAREISHTEPLPSLLVQCRKMSEEAKRAEPEPIRTIHHLACTGGTLIAKCLASLPNTHLLSEVDPLSTLSPATSKRFCPTDLIRLLQAGSRPIEEELLIEVFLGGLDAVYKNDSANGLRLILRDHAHSQFCVGEEVKARPSLLEILSRDFSTRSVVTVRHPLDSYLSLVSHGWRHFRPFSIDEYCRRYHLFLDHYSDLCIYRYEDFIKDPHRALKEISTALSLIFDESFEDTFSVHYLSGDSGRASGKISPRPRRSIPTELEAELRGSDSYTSLCNRLNYELIISAT